MTALTYDRPAQRWTDALPLGNGRLGAMCFGGTDHDRFQLNEATCWSGSPATARDSVPDGPRIIRQARAALAAGDVRTAERLLTGLQGGHSQAYQPLADLWIDEPGPVAGEYTRSLDLTSAVASHSYTGVRQEAWISAPAQALIIRRTTARPLRIRLETPHPSATHGPDLVVRMPSDVGPDGVRYDGLGVTAVVGVRVLSPEPGEVIIVVAVVTDYADPFTDPHGDVEALRRQLGARFGVLETALDRDGGYPAVRAEHVRDHARLFGRVSLRLGAEARQFHYGRYLLIASSRPGSVPANLQGLWNEHRRPPWSSNYTTNINLEMNYWPTGVANLAECRQPLLDWLTHAARRGAGMTRKVYATSGWTLHHNSDPWCFCLPAGAGDDDVAWSFWPLAGAWLSQQIAEHHDYTGDDSRWPVLRGAAEFCLDWLVEQPGGTLGTSPSTSPENHFVAADGKPAAAGVSATADLVLIRDLLASLIRLAPEEDEVVRRARAVLARIPGERVGGDGRVAEWRDDVPDAEPQHRHTSHLIGVYPGHSIDPDTTPELAAAARRTLAARGPESTGWSLAWRIALHARLRDAERAYEAVQRFLRPTAGERSGVYGNLFSAHPPFQIDGNLGFVAGVAEMLLQSHGTAVHVLPALPAAWADGAFTGLRARGGVTVDAEWSAGVLRKVRLVSDTDRLVPIRSGDWRTDARVRASVPLLLEIPAPVG